ncbi:MAG TPA: methyltransferase domain-containing protein [Euzebya sp.]|nr:methyltransferase domain-containing protein [Euzebya sp.]
MEDFFILHQGLDREGPGSAGSTRQALSLVTDLPPDAVVLDIGCGPGAQTLVLAKALPQARIIAVDLHDQFVTELNRRAAAAGVAGRVHAVVGDMAFLPAVLEEAGVDVVDLLWCEGAAYVLGFERALEQWRPLLRPGGRLALTEAVWTAPTVPRAVRDYWQTEYPDLQIAQTRRAQIAAAGYQRIGDFTLPVADWEAYYGPLRTRLDRLRGDPALAGVVAAHDEELAVFDSGGATSVGYQFFVMRRLHPQI